MCINLQHLLGREVSHTTTTNGLTTLAASMPPISFGKTQIPEVVVALPSKQWSGQGDPHSTVVVAEENKIEDTTAVVAVGGWVCGENNISNTSKDVSMDDSKTSSVTVDNGQAPNKRRRVVATQYIVELREHLLAFVNHADSNTQYSKQSHATSSTTDRRQMHPSTARRGIQW